MRSPLRPMWSPHLHLDSPHRPDSKFNCIWTYRTVLTPSSTAFGLTAPPSADEGSFFIYDAPRFTAKLELCSSWSAAHGTPQSRSTRRPTVYCRIPASVSEPWGVASIRARHSKSWGIALQHARCTGPTGPRNLAPRSTESSTRSQGPRNLAPRSQGPRNLASRSQGPRVHGSVT